MSATLGSLALAGVMQSTGAVATETVGNVIFVDFVAGTIIPEYAAATGTTAAAVEAGIASGVTIGTGGLILIGAAALAIIAAIIYWWVSTHKELETADNEFDAKNIPENLRIGSYQITITNNTKPTTYVGTLSDGRKVYNNYAPPSTLKIFDATGKEVTVMNGTDGCYATFETLSQTFLLHNGSSSSYWGTYSNRNPARIYFGAGFLLFASVDKYIAGLTDPTGDGYNYVGRGSSFSRMASPLDLFRFLFGDHEFIYNGEDTGAIKDDGGKLKQKKKKDALEIPQLDPSQELAINTGAATHELPNPNLDEIKKYMDEQVNNPASDPAKGFNYQPPFEVKDIQLPNPKPGDIPITPPVPAPEIPTDPVAPPQLPVLGSSSSGMVRLWNPTAEEMGEISKFMLSGDFIDQVVKLFADPADYLLSLSLQPVTPSVSAKEPIYIGSLPVPNITVAPINSQYATVDFGSIEIPAVYNSFVDYDTQFSIFLPCIGEQPLNTQDMIGSTIHLKYNVDVLTGTFAALLHVSRNTNGINLDAVLYQWQGNLAAQIPIRASSWNVGITDIAAGALAGAAGGPYGAIAGAGVALGKGLLKPRISGSGSLSGNAGLLGIQYPYLIINRPRTATPSNYKGYSGVSTSEVTRLGDLTGYTMVQDTHLQGIPATSSELDEILSLLKGGVIL